MRLTTGGQGTRRKARERPEPSRLEQNARTRAGRSARRVGDLKHWVETREAADTARTDGHAALRAPWGKW
jgi:hypothetical protein